MKHGARQYEKVPYGVHVPLSCGIKNYAEGVGKSARKQEQKSAEREHRHQRFDGENHHPAHGHIAYHGENLEFLYADGVENYSQNRCRPYDAEEQPAYDGIGFPECHEGKGCVCSGDEQEYRAVVEYSENIFDSVGLKRVVEGRKGIEQHHGDAVYYRAYNPPYIAYKGRVNYKYRHAGGGQKSSRTVGY